jgi:hypothetical protein
MGKITPESAPKDLNDGGFDLKVSRAHLKVRAFRPSWAFRPFGAFAWGDAGLPWRAGVRQVRACVGGRGGGVLMGRITAESAPEDRTDGDF